jgi:hypothetical protein
MKFRKRPVVIEATQFYPETQPWPEGVYSAGGPHTVPCWAIGTLEGKHEVTPGDWIITGVAGERYPCKPAIFEATYEAVDG